MPRRICRRKQAMSTSSSEDEAPPLALPLQAKFSLPSAATVAAADADEVQSSDSVIQPVPVTLITGYLGAGASRPSHPLMSSTQRRAHRGSLGWLLCTCRQNNSGELHPHRKTRLQVGSCSPLAGGCDGVSDLRSSHRICFSQAVILPRKTT